MLMPNWIIWNGTAFDTELYLHLIELFNIEPFWHFTVCKQNLYLY